MDEKTIPMHMDNLMSVWNSYLLNVRFSNVICQCPIHDNELLQQLDAQLPNGKFIRVMVDRDGYHVAIGTPTISAGLPLPDEVNREEVRRLILEAM